MSRSGGWVSQDPASTRLRRTPGSPSARSMRIFAAKRITAGTPSETRPVLAVDADRHVDLAHHHHFAVAHVAGIGLDQIGALILPGGEPGGIVEDAAVAAVGSVEDDIAGALRVRVDLVMDR